MRTEDQTISFLFLLKIKDVDFVIMWGAKWASPKKNNQMTCLGIDELFGKKDIFSLLNKCGAVPDRLAINKFITSTIVLDEKRPFNEYIEILGLEYPRAKLGFINIDQMKQEWLQKIDDIKRCLFSGDNGSLIYRDAILKWREVLFDSNPDIEGFALPLLISQVAPWISQQSTITQWAKAYQNLCEIVMLCLDYFPEVGVQENLESIALRDLDPKELYKDKSFKLYSYAMEAIFSVFCQILNREQFKSKQRSIAVIDQNYFETLDLVEQISRENSISFIKGNSLNKLTELPDILLIDIHPNNAAKDQIFENNIGGWITQKLEENAEQKIILILDVTLNNFSDPVLQKILRGLNVFVRNGRLEIFCIQSLAKLIQLGADNFSGGACCHLGQEIFSRTGEQAEQEILEEVKCSADLTHGDSQSKIADQHIIQKSKFFALLMKHFKEIIPKYFSKVRKNTGVMYEILRERFLDISKDIWIGVKNKKGELESFCATNITPNVDESTVYVAISFKSFFEKVNRSDTDKEKLVNRFQKLILKLASLRGLTIIGRQSFGFSLSNMTVAVNSIRFSIGVEAESILIQYANVVTDFSFALSEYVAKDPGKFEIDAFETHLIAVYEIFGKGVTTKSVDLSPAEIFDVDLRQQEFDE